MQDEESKLTITSSMRRLEKEVGQVRRDVGRIAIYEGKVRAEKIATLL